MSEQSANSQTKLTFPPQHQNHQPGIESEMTPRPVFQRSTYKSAGKLKNKTAIITGGDSGIGRAVAVAFAKEGANVVVVYLNEHEDATETKEYLDKIGGQHLFLAGDIGEMNFCQEIVSKSISTYGKLDILVNNAGEQHPQSSIGLITPTQLLRTFQTNVFGAFYLTQAALPYLKTGSSIVNTASITAYKGSKDLIDYSATKGAIVSFTRSLSQSLVGQGIRVNAVAPGPVWTPLIPSTFDETKVSKFGADTPMKRAGQPEELAPSYVFLASDDSAYITGQVIHVNGGVIVNG